MTNLTDLNLDGNPVSKQKYDYYKAILNNNKSVPVIDHKNVDDIKNFLKDEDEKKKKAQL